MPHIKDKPWDTPLDQRELQQRVYDDTPKCANCQHWKPLDVGAATFGKCMKTLLMPVTTDLTVCSKWERRV